jgi:hypothetical protein
MPRQRRKRSVEALVSLAERTKGAAFIASFGRDVQAELAAVMAQERESTVGLEQMAVDLRHATPSDEAPVRAAAEALGLDPEEIVRWLYDEGEKFRVAAALPFGSRAHETLRDEFVGWLENDYRSLRAWLERMERRREERQARNWWKFWQEDEWPALVRVEWKEYRTKRAQENVETAWRLADRIRALSQREYEEWEGRLGELDATLGHEPTGALPLQAPISAYAERGEQLLKRYALKDDLCPALHSVSDDAFEIAKVVTPVAIGLEAAGTLPALAPAAVAAIAIALAKVGIAVYCADRGS